MNITHIVIQGAIRWKTTYCRARRTCVCAPRSNNLLSIVFHCAILIVDCVNEVLEDKHNYI